MALWRRGSVLTAHRDVVAGERGFSTVDVLMGMVVMAVVMTSLTYIMYSSLSDVAFNRQRSAALSLANQAIEEVRALPTSTIEAGMQGNSDPSWSQDPNLTGSCFQQQPLDVNGAKATSTCGTVSWANPTCSTVASGAPTASSLTSPAPLLPHLACYSLSGTTYGVAVYLTGDPNALPLTVWAVVWWLHPIRGGLESHVVTSTSLSGCLTVGSTCQAT